MDQDPCWRVVEVVTQGPGPPCPDPWGGAGTGPSQCHMPCDPQSSFRCLEVTVMKNPRHHPHLPVMAALAPPPASRSHPQSRKMEIPEGRYWSLGDNGAHRKEQE